MEPVTHHSTLQSWAGLCDAFYANKVWVFWRTCHRWIFYNWSLLLSTLNLDDCLLTKRHDSTITAKSVVKAPIHFFSTFGFPKIVQTDQGTHFL